jgi:hypothetical protein
VVARLPDDVDGYTWTPDGRQLCGVLAGAPAPVVLVVAGLDGRPEQLRLAPLFTGVRYSNIGLLACDPRHARAVLQTSYQHVTSVAVVSLSDGAVLAEHDFADTGPGFPDRATPVVSGVVASPDGRYLAVLHAIAEPPGAEPPGAPPAAAATAASTAGPPGAVATVPTGGLAAPVPAYLDVFDIGHPALPVARLAGAQSAAFSGDGSLLAEQLPQAHGGAVSRVVRWSDGRVVWRSSATLAGEAGSPGVHRIALETYQPGQPSDQIVLVGADGQAIPVAAGWLAVP